MGEYLPWSGYCHSCLPPTHSLSAKSFFLKTKYKDAISLTLYVSPRTKSSTVEDGKPSPHNLLRISLVQKHDWLKSLEGDWFIDVFSALFACLPFLEIFMSEWTQALNFSPISSGFSMVVLILDNGAGTIKVGAASDPVPRFVIHVFLCITY